MTAPKLRWYYLPSVGPWIDGWAMIVLGDNGYFSAVSDYGNYAYFWSCHGKKDFREFFLRGGGDGDWDYFLRKLCPRPWPYDGEATARCIKDRILAARRERHYDAVRARMEWERVDDCDVAASLIGFHEWYTTTTTEDAYECGEYSPPAHAVHFCKVTMARFAEMIRAELDAERAASEPEKGDAACQP
jgi:hypothetical protein